MSNLRRQAVMRPPRVVELTVVTSDGTTGQEWVKWFDEYGMRLSSEVVAMLCSPDFKLTSGVRYQVVVIDGDSFDVDDRLTSRFQAEADKQGLLWPELEVACLLRRKLTDREIEQLGILDIVVMADVEDDAPFIAVKSSSTSECQMEAGLEDRLNPEPWGCYTGFVFIRP